MQSMHICVNMHVMQICKLRDNNLCKVTELCKACKSAKFAQLREINEFMQLCKFAAQAIAQCMHIYINMHIMQIFQIPR